MHLLCIQSGIDISRDTVQLMMQIIDPTGIEARLRRRQYFARGPDFLWHLNSYDKLKIYGVCINDCIGGFSRQIIWLHAYTTSRNSRLVAGYYIEAVVTRKRSIEGLNGATPSFFVWFLDIFLIWIPYENPCVCFSIRLQISLTLKGVTSPNPRKSIFRLTWHPSSSLTIFQLSSPKLTMFVS